jgi:hypothetical protein
MTPAVGDYLQIRLYCRQAEQLGVNVLHQQVTLITNPAITDQMLCDELSNQFGPSLRNLMASDASYFGLALARFVGTLPVTLAVSRVGTGVGGAAGVSLPRQTSGLLTLRTVLPGRANRGRMYLPFPASSFDITGGVPNSTYNGFAFGTMNQVIGPSTYHITGAVIGDVDLIGVVKHRTPFGFTPFSTGTVQPRWATQKRRGSYGRPNVDPF